MAAKLPRRTMSMAKRAVKAAEDAADLDVVEGAIGAPHERPPVFEGMLGWVGAIFGIVMLMLAGTLVCNVANSGDPDFSPPGAQSEQERTGSDFYREGDPNDGRMGAGRDSPFPEAEQEDPIILEVVCPPDTVHVSTGSTPADSLCVVGELAGAAPTPTLQVAPTFAPTSAPTVAPLPTDTMPQALPDAGHGDQSTIGATLVPFGLHCAEDEIIGFDPNGQRTDGGLPLGCIHVDTFCPEGQHVGASDTCEPDR